MNDAHHPGNEPMAEPLPPEAARDLEALAQESRRLAPTLAETAHMVAAREAGRGNRGMNQNRGWAFRPTWGIATGIAAVAFVLLFVPVSFDRPIGQQLRFTIEGAQLAAHDVQGLLAVLHKQCGDGPVSVDQGTMTSLETKLRGKSRAEVETVAAALQKELAAKGLTARYEIAPWTERVSSNVYAYAAAQFRELNVSTAGRSEAEVESDIRSQLESMGFQNPNVSFSRTDNGSEMRVEAEDAEGNKIVAEARHEVEGNHPAGEPDFNIMMLDPAELKGKSDAEIKAIVEQHLAERGIKDAQVTVEDGKVRVEARQEIRK